MITKHGLSSLRSAPSSGGSPFKFKVGKVFATVMDEKTPSKKVFDQCGGWSGVGTVLFKFYPSNKGKDIYEENTTSNAVLGYSTAKPLFPNQKYIPFEFKLGIVLR